mmetsp:Transcript_55547/g.132808  ORF Transcript_55547/g.132808 Transcript_55547/m.132808 type:complete len:403 (+) Transcript_55547:478-1686(+)
MLVQARGGRHHNALPDVQGTAFHNLSYAPGALEDFKVFVRDGDVDEDRELARQKPHQVIELVQFGEGGFVIEVLPRTAAAQGVDFSGDRVPPLGIPCCPGRFGRWARPEARADAGVLVHAEDTHPVGNAQCSSLVQLFPHYDYIIYRPQAIQDVRIAGAAHGIGHDGCHQVREAVAPVVRHHALSQDWLLLVPHARQSLAFLVLGPPRQWDHRLPCHVRSGGAHHVEAPHRLSLQQRLVEVQEVAEVDASVRQLLHLGLPGCLRLRRGQARGRPGLQRPTAPRLQQAAEHQQAPGVRHPGAPLQGVEQPVVGLAVLLHATQPHNACECPMRARENGQNQPSTKLHAQDLLRPPHLRQQRAREVLLCQQLPIGLERAGVQVGKIDPHRKQQDRSQSAHCRPHV